VSRAKFGLDQYGALLPEPSPLPECKNLVEIAICMLPVLHRISDAFGFSFSLQSVYHSKKSMYSCFGVRSHFCWEAVQLFDNGSTCSTYLPYLKVLVILYKALWSLQY